MDIKNFASSCERNKAVIFEHLKAALSSHQERFNLTQTKVLELGSYSGQHAIHFCQQLNKVQWQPSDVEQNIALLKHNLGLFSLNNCLAPITLDVSNKSQWPNKKYDLIFTANTLHIMSWQHVEQLFDHMVMSTESHAMFLVYGPFKYRGDFTSPSNAEFDVWLKDRDPQSGIRDLEKVTLLANNAGFTLEHDIDMPANNQLLVWQKTPL
ncbi:DUF938 domain-containing protein [Thalassotalea atypica]|uniref:DUF938 domain-containing protein n=1 Tax=Thalassotalea atypica TaxID=2054316 RepID=UPI002573E9E7|nr:DUF938 domain-containing protein [Thalassotalea atypica]